MFRSILTQETDTQGEPIEPSTGETTHGDTEDRERSAGNRARTVAPSAELTGNSSRDGRLAGTGLPDDGEDLALRQLEIDATNGQVSGVHPRRAVVHREVTGRDHG